MRLQQKWLVTAGFCCVLAAGAALRGQSNGDASAQSPATPKKAATPIDWTRLLPNGPGKEYVTARCTGCHDAKVLLVQGRTRGDWAELMRRANLIWDSNDFEVCACLAGPLPEEEIAIISSYLAEAFGPEVSFDQLPVNINTASERILSRLPGLGQSEVRKIVEARRHAPFKTKVELEKVLGPDKFRAVQDFVAVQDSNFRSEGLLPM